MKTKRPAMSAWGQKIRVDNTLNTVIGLSSSAFEIKITDLTVKTISTGQKTETKVTKMQFDTMSEPCWNYRFPGFKISDFQ